MKAKLFYIKERFNPQLGTYYVRLGQMSKAAAKRIEGKSLYGSNIVHGFETEQDYNAKVAELRSKGESVQ